jgi:hypothetical protein
LNIKPFRIVAFKPSLSNRRFQTIATGMAQRNESRPGIIFSDTKAGAMPAFFVPGVHDMHAQGLRTRSVNQST